jgi:hypothetical protein
MPLGGLLYCKVSTQIGGYIRAKFWLPLGGLHVKHAVQRGIWVPTQHLLWDRGKPRKTWSQDLPDANWLLASSPALKTRTLTLVPIWLLLYLYKFTYYSALWMASKQLCITLQGAGEAYNRHVHATYISAILRFLFHDADLTESTWRYCHLIEWLKTRFGLVAGFIGHSH